MRKVNGLVRVEIAAQVSGLRDQLHGADARSCPGSRSNRFSLLRIPMQFFDESRREVVHVLLGGVEGAHPAHLAVDSSQK